MSGDLFTEEDTRLPWEMPLETVEDFHALALALDILALEQAETMRQWDETR
jgi:hypothetical protein